MRKMSFIPMILEREASFFVSSKLKGKRLKTTRQVLNKDHSLSYYIDLFLESKIAEGRAKRTIQKYRDNFKSFVDYLGYKGIDVNLDALHTQIIRAYVVYLLQEKIRFEHHKFKSEAEQTKGLSPVTVNTRLKSIKTLSKFLVTEGYLKSDPTKNIKDVKENEEAIEVLSADELRSLLNAPNQKFYSEHRDTCLITLLIDGMLRISEALNLERRDIDYLTNVLTVRAEIAKSRKARHIPLQKKTVNLLKELIKETEEFDSEYIFLANYGEQLQPNHFRKQLRLYAKRAGIKKRVHPHLIRHSAATIFLENGGDLRHLQLLLGHGDLRMVLRYTHLSNKSLIAQQNQYSVLNSVVGKLSKNRKIKR